MAWCNDKIKLIALTIIGILIERDASGLDGNAALALDNSGVKKLIIHLPFFQPPTVLNETIGKRRFTMIDMGNDGKIADKAYIRHEKRYRRWLLACTWSAGGKSTLKGRSVAGEM